MSNLSHHTTAAEFIRAVGYPLQLVALHPEMGGVAVFHAADAAGLAQAVVKVRSLNAEGWNAYYEVNVGAAGRRSKASDVTNLRAVVGDVDVKGGRSLAGCIAAVAGLPVAPSYTIATGGGLQVAYLLAEPEAVTPASVATYDAAGRAIRDMIDGDAVFDLPRIMRLPGFVNWPSERKRAAGREPVKAKVLAWDGRRYSLAELAGAFAPTTKAPPVRGACINDDLSGGLEVDRWFDKLPSEARDECLRAMLKLPAIVALADTSDGASYPNWRTVLAACARSGAPNAREICEKWARTSTRFDSQDFSTRWASYAR